MRSFKIQKNLTTQRTDNINRYFREVNVFPTLTPEEEFEIATRAKNGDQKAKELLINSNLKFVISIAKHYSNPNYAPLSDLISEGNIGLIEAAETFDPSTGFKFISYAVWRIRKQIYKYLNEKSRQIYLPNNLIKDLSLVKKTEDFLVQNLEREVSIDEILENIDKNSLTLSIESLRTFLISEIKTIPLENNSNEDEFSPIDTLQSDSQTDSFSKDFDAYFKLKAIASMLNPIEKDIFFKKNGIGLKEPMTFFDIAKEYERSPEWARQIFRKTIRKLKTRSKKLLIQ